MTTECSIGDGDGTELLGITTNHCATVDDEVRVGF